MQTGTAREGIIRAKKDGTNFWLFVPGGQ